METKNIKGFTLVELVFVIAVVVVLSVVAGPIYKGYADKALMTEGYALLGNIRQAQKAYFRDYGTFLKAADSSSGGTYADKETVLGINTTANKYFKDFVVGIANKETYYFEASVLKPTKLRNGNNTALVLQHNITAGSTIVDNTKLIAALQ